MPDPLLELRDLRIAFRTPQGVFPAVTGVDLSIGRGETVALVGESGSGKTVTALAIARLLPGQALAGLEGQVTFDGVDLMTLSERAMRSYRGGRIAYIFQEPGAALNPVFTVRYQIEEVLRLHGRGEGRKGVTDLLASVGIDDPARVAASYPHQLSGGQQQRVMIAAALASGPDLLVADEPTTALDVTVQAQILELLKRIRTERNMAILLITHNLAVAADIADRLYVMYAGQVVESGPSRSVLKAPAHPYTRALLEAVPRLLGNRARLSGIAGTPPAGSWPAGCRFHPRCPSARPVCATGPVETMTLSVGRISRCRFRPEEQIHA